MKTPTEKHNYVLDGVVCNGMALLGYVVAKLWHDWYAILGILVPFTIYLFQFFYWRGFLARKAS